MTAEIAILNKNGVALAADSKVTIGMVGQQKTFDTVNKLFTLSKVCPVAVMIFGNAEFMQYPWETIVKLYRQHKGKASEPTIAAWSTDFIAYLRKFGNIRPEDKTRNLQIVLGSLFEEIHRSATVDARRKGLGTVSKELISTKLMQAIIRLQRDPDLLTAQESGAFAADFGGELAAIVDHHFKGFGDQDLINHARQAALLSVAKKRFSAHSCGFVIAGFGDDEYFPALEEYSTDGYVGDTLKIAKEQHHAITRDYPAAICAFAQKDMVHRFMDGIDPQLSAAIPKLFTSTTMQNCLEILEKYGDPVHKNEATKKLIREAVSSSIAALSAPFKKIQNQTFSNPIMQMISLLPKDELPHLAESLVGLTSLKRHVSSDAETVGGPIDVALISKGDGFIWIERKHYFKPELNQQFARTYMRGIIGDDHEDAGTPRLDGASGAGKRKKRR